MEMPKNLATSAPELRLEFSPKDPVALSRVEFVPLESSSGDRMIDRWVDFAAPNDSNAEDGANPNAFLSMRDMMLTQRWKQHLKMPAGLGLVVISF